MTNPNAVYQECCGCDAPEWPRLVQVGPTDAEPCLCECHMPTENVAEQPIAADGLPF